MHGETLLRVAYLAGAVVDAGAAIGMAFPDRFGASAGQGDAARGARGGGLASGVCNAAARFRDDWLPNADWVELDDIGHCPQLDIPLETSQLIIGFTAAHGPQPPRESPGPSA
jgi:hypothetical protein